MKAEDLKTKTTDELTKLLLETRKEKMNLRFQRSGGQLENTAQIRNVRRKIARIKTFLGAQNAPEGSKKKKPAANKAPAKKTTKKAAEKAA